MKCMAGCGDEAVKEGFCLKHAYVDGPDLELFNDPPVGTGGGGAKSVTIEEEDVTGFEDANGETTDGDNPPAGTGGCSANSDPPVGTGKKSSD